MLDLDFGPFRRRRGAADPAPVAEPADDRARILTVCTGNVCRSPLAEQLLRQRLSGFPVIVESSGTRALAGETMDGGAVRLASDLGVDADDSDAHRGRQLREDQLVAPDLVLAMDRTHRRQVVELSPALTSRVFTVREFARLTQHLSLREIRRIAEGAGDGVRARITAVGRRVLSARGETAPPADPADDDVVDPFRQSWEQYQRSSAQLVPAVDEVVRVLRETLR